MQLPRFSKSSVLYQLNDLSLVAGAGHSQFLHFPASATTYRIYSTHISTKPSASTGAGEPPPPPVPTTTFILLRTPGTNELRHFFICHRVAVSVARLCQEGPRLIKEPSLESGQVQDCRSRSTMINCGRYGITLFSIGSISTSRVMINASLCK
jgi:hypothetical protein